MDNMASLENNDSDSDRFHVESSHRSTLNRISVSQTWFIEEFESRLAMLEDKTSFYSPITSVPVEMVGPDILDGKGQLEFGIRMTKNKQAIWFSLNSLNETPLFLSFEIEIMNANGDKWKGIKNEHFNFNPQNCLGWKFFDTNDFNQVKDQVLKNNTLKVVCSTTIFSDKLRVSERSNKRQKVATLSDDLMEMQCNKKLSDVQLECDGKVFACHKSILSARSAVFEAMFSNGTLEAQTNNVKIKDIESNTLEQMVEFIYTDKTVGLPENAYSLFCAAEKYDIQSLKVQCEEILVDFMNVEKACDCLVLSYMYNSDALKEVASKYIANHIFEIMKTDGWTNITETHPKIMKEILQAIASKDG